MQNQQSKSSYYWRGSDLYLNLHLQPNANKDAIIGIHDNKIKICIKAAPIEGKANKHLISFLAKYFGVTKKDVQLLKGLNGREKLICINNPTKNLEHYQK